jgi:hypothetical protein
MWKAQIGRVVAKCEPKITKAKRTGGYDLRDGAPV